MYTTQFKIYSEEASEGGLCVCLYKELVDTVGHLSFIKYNSSDKKKFTLVTLFF